MNERIRQLAVEANLITHKVPNGLAHLHTEKDLEKFAELLIKKCAGICKDTAEKEFSPLYNRESDGATACYKKIKQHFGVSE